MQKKIVINCDNKQTRVAVLEDGKPVEIYLERPVHQRVVGNIYKGIVANVLPGMQAAFINIGNGDSAGLHNPAYEFNDAAIPVGVNYWASLIEIAMPQRS